MGDRPITSGYRNDARRIDTGDDAPPELANHCEQGRLVSLELAYRSRFIDAHKSAVTSDIGSQDSYEPARLAIRHRRLRVGCRTDRTPRSSSGLRRLSIVVKRSVGADVANAFSMLLAPEVA